MTHKNKFITFFEKVRKNLPYEVKATNRNLFSMFIYIVSLILQTEKISSHQQDATLIQKRGNNTVHLSISSQVWNAGSAKV